LIFVLLIVWFAVAVTQHGVVRRRDLGDAWPFTVERGRLGCSMVYMQLGRPPVPSLTFTADDGRIFGLNGVALTYGALDVLPIWVPDPANPGAYKNIGPLQDRARALCP
jgi:hypothetical protein